MIATLPSVRASAVDHLHVEGLSLRRGGKWLVRDLTLKLPAGKLVAVLGPSGVGKSSLLACIAGQLAATEGGVRACTRDGGRVGKRELRGRVAVVWQDFRLVRNLTLLTNVQCGRLARYSWLRTLPGMPRSDRDEAMDAIRALGLESCTHRWVREMSGGEQQRGAVARALHQDADVVLADEPVSNLDAANAELVMSNLARLARERGRLVVCVMHHPHLARRHADTILTMTPGLSPDDGARVTVEENVR